MADASSSGEGIEENPIETAISRGASLSEPAVASISRKRKVIVNHGKYKASREQKNLKTVKRRFGTGFETTLVNI